MEAKKEADAVAKIKEVCQADAKRIAGEKVYHIIEVVITVYECNF